MLITEKLPIDAAGANQPSKYRYKAIPAHKAVQADHIGRGHYRFAPAKCSVARRAFRKMLGVVAAQHSYVSEGYHGNSK